MLGQQILLPGRRFGPSARRAGLNRSSSRRLVGWAGVLLLAAMPAQVFAFDTAAVQACSRLPDARERLHCYDRAVGRRPQRGNGNEQPAAHTGPGHFGPAAADTARAQQEIPPASGLTRRWYESPEKEWAGIITSYKPVYALPISYNTRPNQDSIDDRRDGVDIDNLEIKFQFSFKARLWQNLLVDGGDLWFGYTQLAFWQAYNRKLSAPFRDTNYEPELIYSLRTHFNLLGLHGRLLTLSLNHQSNGRSNAMSRSWNRIIGGMLLDNGNIAFQARAWWRIPESSANDDNPHIEDYVGRSELWGFYRRNGQIFGLMLRSNLDPKRPRGAVQLDWVIPLGGPLKGYLQWFYGYGESLIDYNHINNRLSLGLSLIDWL